MDQKWQSLQDSIQSAEALIAEENSQPGAAEKSPSLLAAQKKLADARKLIGELSTSLPALQKLARLASMPEQNILPILEINLNGEVEYLNPAAQKLFPDLQEKGSAHAYLAGWQEMVEKFYQAPAFYLEREVEVNGCDYQQSIIYIKEHNCLRVYGRDVTARMKAEQALEQSEKRFRTLIDEAPVAIALSHESKFLYVNPAYLELHGIENAAELIGQPIYERVAPESLDESRERADRRKRGLPVEKRYEYTALRKDGSRVSALAAVTSVTLTDGPATVGFFQDITERKQAERSLQQSQALLNSVISTTSDLIFLKDRDCRLLLANPAFIEAVGKPAEQIIGKTDEEFYDDPAVGRAFNENDRRVMESGQTELIEEYQSLPGSQHVYLSTKTPYRDAQGNIIGVICVAHDITRRKQVEKEREELLAQVQLERDRLQSLIDNMNDEVWFCDQHGKVLLANRAAMQNIGYNSLEEMLTSVSALANDLEVYNPDGTPRATDEAAFTRTLKSGAPVFGEDIVRNRRTGELKYREYNTALIHSAGGIVLGAVAVVRDVSQRKQAEQALHQSQSLLNTIMDETPDPVFLKDRDSRLLLANPATLAVIGKPAEQVIGKTDAEFYDDPAVGYAIMEHDRQVMESGQTEVVEEQVSVPGSQRVFLSTKTPYRDVEGKIIGVIGISRDITERKQREVELYQLSRTLRAISNSNQALMHAESESQFIDQVCNIIVKDCGYRMVWIGFAEQDPAKTVRPVASAGFEQGYIDTLNITWADTERGQGPTGRAIRSGQPSLCRDMHTDPSFKPWYAEAIKRGYKSSLVLPLLSGGLAFGALTLYSEVIDPFSDDEIKLLSELANDLAYGITSLRLRQANLKAETALRASEERYRSLFAGMTEGFALHEIICDEAGQPSDYRFLELNPAFERLTGLKQEDVVGRLMSQVLPDDDPNWVKIYGKVALTGQPTHFENYSPVLKAHYEVFAYCPAPNQFAVLFMNITERKQAQERIAFQANLLANISDVVYATDVQLRLTAWNYAAERTYGWKEEEVLGKPVTEIVRSKFDPELRVKIARDLEEKGSVNTEIEHETKIGVPAFFETQTSLLRDMDGKINGYLSINRDITERKRAEEKLRASEERYRRLFDNLHETLVIHEVDLDETGRPVDLRFVDVNPAAERVFGKTRSEIVGKTRSQLSGQPDSEGVEMAGRVLSTGTPIHSVRHSPGFEGWFESSIFPLGSGMIASLALDITERKLAEEKLRQSEERYRSLFEHIQETLVILELVMDEAGKPMDLRYVDVNPAAERALGKACSEIVGRTRSELGMPPDPEGLEIAVSVLSASTQNHMVRYSPILKSWSESFTYSVGSNVVATLALDISERMQAEEKLRQSESLYRGIGEAIDYGVWVCAPDGRNTFASDSFLKLVGLTQQQCSDFGWGDVLHPDDAERTLAAWKECVSTGGTWDIEHRYRGVDGQWHPILARGVAIRDESGQVTSWAGINLDISKQKQAEEALQKSHNELEQRVQERTEQLQAINEELNAEIVERKEVEEVIRRNAARAENLAEISRRLAAAGLGLQKVCEIVSRSMAELIGDICVVNLLSEDGKELSLASLYHKDSGRREHFSKTMQNRPIKVGQGIAGKVVSTGHSFFLPSTAPHKLAGLIEPQDQSTVDGLQIYSLMCVPLRQEGKITGTIAVMGGKDRKPFTLEDLSFLEDLAERAGLSIAKARIYQALENALERDRQSRAQLIQSEKNSALARMVASVAHEINNPVQTIKNCMYLLGNDIEPASQSGEILKMASSEANRIGDLVSRLRDLYRPSKEMAVKTVNIVEVLHDVSALLEPHLQHNKVKMEIETCSDRVCVTANSDQIKQVFLNISLNAIDAMQPVGGRLTAKVSCPTALQTCISFTDTGKGISSEEMQHIFEPLYTTKDKGTGLGLAISHEIAKNHNGYITVESQPGQGSTFSVWLPTTHEDADIH